MYFSNVSHVFGFAWVVLIISWNMYPGAGCMVSLVAVLMVLDIDFPDSMVVAVNAELVISYCGLPSKRGTQKWSMKCWWR